MNITSLQKHTARKLHAGVPQYSVVRRDNSARDLFFASPRLSNQFNAFYQSIYEKEIALNILSKKFYDDLNKLTLVVEKYGSSAIDYSNVVFTQSTTDSDIMLTVYVSTGLNLSNSELQSELKDNLKKLKISFDGVSRNGVIELKYSYKN